MRLINQTEFITNQSDNKWIAILDDVRQAINVPTKKATILFLGSRESGKTALAERLRPKRLTSSQHSSKLNAHFGLESHYIELSSEDTIDEKMDIWIADGDNVCSQMLHYAINETSLSNALVVLTVSISEPWLLLKTINGLFDTIYKHIQSLQGHYVDDCCRLRESKFEDCWRPEVITPMPILVVITKTDLMSDLRKDLNYLDEHFEFIQMHIRKLCLKYGAGVLFTSNYKQSTNEDDLFRTFVMQTCFNTSSSNEECSILTVGNLLDYENVYIPPGWDRDFKISVLSQAFKQLDGSQVFTDVIQMPNNIDNFKKELPSEIVSDNYQKFLESLKNKLARKSANNDLNHDRGEKKSDVTRKVPFPSAKKSQNTDTILSTIFNNLLSKPQLLQSAKSTSTRDNSDQLKSQNRKHHFQSNKVNTISMENTDASALDESSETKSNG